MKFEAVPTWAADRLGKLPARWRDRLEYQWRKHAQFSSDGMTLEAWKAEKAGRIKKADAWLTRRLDELEAGARAGVHPAMDDAAICKLAEQEARDHGDRQNKIAGDFRRAVAREVPSDDLGAALLQLLTADAKQAMQGRGLLDLYPNGPTMTEAGKLARLKCRAFWRRVLRKVHARTVEQCAIALGIVNGNEDVYLSRESLRIQMARQTANAAMLANSVAVGEYGQEMTLASVAERSVSNPTIRRGELMTRVSGFELCADQMGHVKRWAVLTCPSRMHKFTTVDLPGGKKKTVENRRYDGTKPGEAQRYLAGQWRKLCAWWARQGLRVYGFRTTEPHKDATPHWNVLCFFAPMTDRVTLKTRTKEPRRAVVVFDKGLRRYFLFNDQEATEQLRREAKKRRVKIKAIEDGAGSAAAYIAKYISKGIDGKGLERDLWGNPIETATKAVVAWSRVWGIRQFQQIGGPPVTVWRELRKLNPENLGTEAETADTLRSAAAAVNLRLDEPDEKMAVAWKRYTDTQGGPCAKRKAWKVRMLMQQRETANRYGEASAARMVGVWAAGRVPTAAPAHLAARGINAGGFYRPAFTAIESERCAWVVVSASQGRADAVDEALREHCARLEAQIAAMDAEAAERARVRIAALQRQSAAFRALEGELSPEEVREREALAPWTRVNNCTATPTLDRLDRRHMDTAPAAFGPLKRRRAKLGRHYEWKSREAGGLSTNEEKNGQSNPTS